MNKKETLEIRKQFTNENCAITRICGCYVDAEKEIRTELKEAFLSLPEEEAFKYYDIFRKTLSGTVGKNLITLDFPTDQEMPDGAQAWLLKLRDSRLEDDVLLEEFYEKIIKNYAYGENYYIILIHAAYDIPKKASDGMEMFDASDDTYEYLLCSICPVKLSKAGLCYNAQENSIEDRIRDWIVQAPDAGFLFPAFNDRNTDLHSMLYYTRNPEILQPSLMDGLFGCAAPLSAKGQKETFQELLTESLEDACSYETVVNIHESLNELIEEKKDLPEPPTLKKPEMKYQKIMKRSLEPDTEPDITRGTLEGDIIDGPITFFRLQSTADAKLQSYIAQGEVLPVETKSFGGIGVFAIDEMARFYRHVLVAKHYPHHGGVAFGHVGKALFAAMKLLGVQDVAFNQPKGMLYKDENPFA